jgi:hypothetical protein
MIAGMLLGVSLTDEQRLIKEATTASTGGPHVRMALELPGSCQRTHADLDIGIERLCRRTGDNHPDFGQILGQPRPHEVGHIRLDFFLGGKA